MIAITGANGQLGELVIQALLKNTRADQIVAAVRNPEKANALKTLGVQIRHAGYDKPETLSEAFQDVEKLLLISAVLPGERLRQRRAAIDAAKQAGVGVVAYTSLLRADTSDLALTAYLPKTLKQVRCWLQANGRGRECRRRKASSVRCYRHPQDRIRP